MSIGGESTMSSHMVVRLTAVRENGLVADFHVPDSSGKHPGVIVIGGSRGGMDRASATAALLAQRGYAALGLAYFHFEHLPRQLKEIPLEYFKQAIDWMRSNPWVEADRIGLLGTSKGGEAALLLSATYPAIRAVVAYVPSHVVFQSITYTLPPRQKVKSSWTLQGKPVPFVPYRYSLKSMWQHGFMRGLYLGSLQDPDAVDPAIIPVERINGPILLVSGEDDSVWLSSMMCTLVTERLTHHGFRFPFQHVSYDSAGHISPGPGKLLSTNPRYIGGTETGNAIAGDDAWEKSCRFLDSHLKQ